MYYGIKDKLSDLIISREYLDNAWKMNIQIDNYKRTSIITTLTSIESYFLILKIQALLNDLGKTPLRKIY